MKQTLHLYNHFHNGDIFCSRVLIEELCKFYNIEYYHNLKTPLLPDYDNVVEINGIPSNFDVHHSNFSQNQINTWIGQNNFKYLKSIKEGCCFDNYMTIINEIFDYYQIPKKRKEEYLPIVNFDKVENISKIDLEIKKLKTLFSKIVLISNGNVHSGQSNNFSFEPIIKELSFRYPNILFLITENINCRNNNIIYSSEITKINPDLLQISYISKFCDIIVGRASGPYSYSLNKENLLNDKKIFISFNNSFTEANYWDSAKCKLIWSNDYTFENILNTISVNIY